MHSKIKIIVRFILIPFTSLLYWLGGFVPKRRNRWIFGSYANSFNDNSKYLYIHVIENHPEIDAIWITGNQKICEQIKKAGGKAYTRWSLAGVKACLTGGYWFFSAYVGEINYYCSRKATLINLWHGIPLKKIEFDIERGPLANQFQNPSIMERYIIWPAIYKKPDYILSTSVHVSIKSFASAFRVNPNQCLNLGYPRTDGFFKTNQERLRIIQQWDPPATRALIEKISGYSRSIIYMPTWRDANPNFIEKSGWDFHSINESLVQKNMILLLKLHVATPDSIMQSAINLSNIHIMQPTEDAYSVLPFTSGLITDYSSILFDYLLLDKPIYYYPFDQKEYELDSRGFYHTYVSCTAGHHINSPIEVIDLALANDDHRFEQARKKLRRRFFEYNDSSASERIVNKICSLW